MGSIQIYKGTDTGYTLSGSNRSLMRCFISIPKILEEAGLLKKGCLVKAELIINDLLGSWFNGICNFLKQVIPLPLAR